jgi:hypothetical protein
MSLSLEELSKVWSVFFQSPYVLSVAYNGSAVLIKPTSRAASLPVQTRNIYVLPFRQPTIDKVVSSPANLNPSSQHDIADRANSSRRRDPGPVGRRRADAYIISDTKILRRFPRLQAGATD